MPQPVQTVRKVCHCNNNTPHVKEKWLLGAATGTRGGNLSFIYFWFVFFPTFTYCRLWRAFLWKHFFSSYLKFGNKDTELAGKLALALPKDVKIAGTSDPALASCLLPDMWRIERGGCYQPTRSWTTSTSTQASCSQKLKWSKHCKRAQRNSMSSDWNERLGAV